MTTAKNSLLSDRDPFAKSFNQSKVPLNNNSNIINQQLQARRRISMIVELSGEMANNLAHLMHAYATKLLIEEAHPHLRIDLLGEHQDNVKYKHAAKDISKCFLNLRNFEFQSGKWDTTGEYDNRTKALKSWLHRRYNEDLSILDVDSDFKKSMNVLQELLEQQRKEHMNDRIQEPKNATISFPYLRIHKMRVQGSHIEKYHKHIQEWLAWDDKRCCNQLPSSDELVFHYRNFIGESSNNDNYLVKVGFVEVGPKHVASFLLDHLRAGKIEPTTVTEVTEVAKKTNGGNRNDTEDGITGHLAVQVEEQSNQGPWKVAMIARLSGENDHSILGHTQAISEAGIPLRVIRGQSGVQDFCVLLKAKYVVGSALSSFSIMAGILGNQSTVSLYTIDARETRQYKSAFLHNSSFWKSNPTLKERFHHEVYPVQYRN